MRESKRCRREPHELLVGQLRVRMPQIRTLKVEATVREVLLTR